MVPLLSCLSAEAIDGMYVEKSISVYVCGCALLRGQNINIPMLIG